MGRGAGAHEHVRPGLRVVSAPVDDAMDARAGRSQPAASPQHLPRLLTAAEVAEQTGLPHATVYELTRRGELPAVRIGERHYRYSAPAVREWLAAGGTRGDDAA